VGSTSGAVHVVSGGTSEIYDATVEASARFTVVGDATVGWIGHWRPLVADLDDDGTRDLGLDAANQGLLVFYDAGAASGTVTSATPDLRIHGDSSFYVRSGYDAGDFDGDGADDLFLAGMDSPLGYLFQGPLPTTGTLNVNRDPDVVLAGLAGPYPTIGEGSLVTDLNADGDGEIILAEYTAGSGYEGRVSFVEAP
jgi:hypothetical protein